MPLLKTPAIVLKSRKWGDADRIVTYFTLKHGKVRGVARGARRMKSRFGGTLEPFVYCDLVLYEKPGDSLYRVSQTDVREAFHPLRSSLETIAGAARVKREPARCPAVSPACLAFFRQVLRMDPARLPRLKASASLRNELHEVIELYVDHVAGRRMPRTHGMLGEGRVSARPGRAGETLAAEPQRVYQRVVTT